MKVALVSIPMTFCPTTQTATANHNLAKSVNLLVILVARKCFRGHKTFGTLHYMERRAVDTGPGPYLLS